MMPPTSIDGTDITGATIDGTDVTEITVDGQTVFSAGLDIPASVVHHYDPESEAVGSRTTWTDSVGTADMTGNFEIINSGINNLKTARFDGVNDTVGNSSINVTTFPFATVFVAEYQGSSSEDTFYLNTDTDLNFAFRYGKNNSQYQIFIGGVPPTVNQIGGTTDNDAHVFVIEAKSNGDITVDLDGTNIISDNGAGAKIDGLNFAPPRTGTVQSEVDFGDFLITENHAAGDLSSLESQLASKYNITI